MKISPRSALRKKILELLEERGPGKTICPSDAARAVAPSDARADWEPLMEPARQAARSLVAQGKLVVTQRGKVVDLACARGPIRFRLAGGKPQREAPHATVPGTRSALGYRSRRSLV